MEKLINLLKPLLSNSENYVILWIGLFYLIALISHLVITKRFPVLGTLLLFLLVVFTGIYIYKDSIIPESVTAFLLKNFNTMKMAILNILIYFLSIEILLFLFRIYQKEKQQAFIMQGYTDIPFDLIMIANKNGKIIHKTEYGLDILQPLMDQKNTQSIVVNDKSVETNLFFKTLNSSIDLVNINLSITNNTGEVKKFKFFKKNLYINNKYNGFLLYNHVERKEIIDSVTFINAFDEPIAQLDAARSKYLINDQFAKLLKISTNSLTVELFREYVYKEDLVIFTNISSNKINVFRMSIENIVYWFDASFVGDSGSLIIRRTSLINNRNRLSLNTYNNLIDSVEKYKKLNKDFGLLSISFQDINKLKFKDGNDLTNTLISHYLKSLYDGKYKNEIEVYQLSNIEFAIVVNNILTYDIIAKEIVEGKNGIFKEVSYIVNNENYKIDIAAGLVSSKGNEAASSAEMIEYSYMALKEALDPEYPNNYSIYYPMEKALREYSLADFDIDLSEGFLEKFKI